MPVPIPPRPALTAATPPKRTFLLLGTCQFEGIVQAAGSAGHHADHHLLEALRHSAIPTIDTASYDAAVIALTLRHIVSDATGLFFGASDMALTRLVDHSQVEDLLARCLGLIEQKLDALHAAMSDIPLFFLSFLEPSFNYAGLLIDPYAPTAPRAVMRELNRRFAEQVSRRANCYFIDINDLANAVGRLHLHDDTLAGALHGATINEAMAEFDRDRLVAVAPNSDLFDYPVASAVFADLFWRHLGDALAVLRQDDPIKLIIVDLDDTLWRGVAADSALPHWARIEGWPIGFVEALLFFKRRGGLLAICSKNDRATTLERLRAIWHGALAEDDFAAIRINWDSKAENIAGIIAETNILPGNALFIDDNPRELDEVAARFPAIRTLGGRPHDWRRAILCAPQTQVRTITAESSRRTELVRARAEREAASLEIDRAAWLASLDLQETIARVVDPTSAEGERAFELINKTNQFNTTGRRWGLAEFHDFVSGTGVCLIATLKDRNVDNGIVGVSLIQAGEIVQTVLSCRVFGLGAEIVLGAVATTTALRQAPTGVATGRVVDTGKNLTCHGYFEALGYRRAGDQFETQQACAMPAWITVQLPE